MFITGCFSNTTGCSPHCPSGYRAQKGRVNSYAVYGTLFRN